MVGFGIDFGTTNSVAAVYDPRSGLLNALTTSTQQPHPSVVWYRPDGLVVVGDAAKRSMETKKDEAGHSFFTSIKSMLSSSIMLNHVNKGELSPIEVASEIFKHLRKEAEKNPELIGLAVDNESLELTQATVTIPIYFKGRQRRAIREAARLGGIHVNRFIHEPFAAITGYFFRKKQLKHLLSEMNKRVLLVFDWGGGTLDVTVVLVENGQLIELGTGALPRRAGDSFDNEIRNWIRGKEIREKELNLEVMDMSISKDRFALNCERKKIELSGQQNGQAIQSVTITTAQAYEYKGEIHDLSQELSRNEFNILIQDDVKAALYQVDKALENAELSHEHVSHVLLIGGSSKIPYVQNELKRKFGDKLLEVDRADTIIAEGAAVIDSLDIHPTLARGIGVELATETLNEQTDQNSYLGTSHRIYEIFKTGDSASPEKCNKDVHFYCVDHMDGKAKVILNDIDTRNNRVNPVKILEVPVVPYIKASGRHHEQVEVNFSIDEDMVLKVTGKGLRKYKETGGESEVFTEIYDLCFGLELVPDYV